MGNELHPLQPQKTPIKIQNSPKWFFSGIKSSFSGARLLPICPPVKKSVNSLLVNSLLVNSLLVNSLLVNSLLVNSSPLAEFDASCDDMSC